MSTSSPEGKKEQEHTKRGTLAIGISLALAVLVLVSVVFFLLKTTNVVDTAALKVGDREVSRTQYDEYIQLAKKTFTSAKDAKEVIVEYEKNKNLAASHKLNIPESLVALSRTDMITSAASTGKANLTSLRTADDAFTQLRLYNTAFTNYVQQSTVGGWGVVLYDIPVIPSTNEADAVKRARSSAEALRKELADKKITVAEAVARAQQLNIGQPAQSGFYRIREEDGAVLGQYGGGMYARLLAPDFILSYLKSKQPGLTDVQDFEKRSVFFTDILYAQKKDAKLPGMIEKEKTEMKVVDYVDQ